MKKLLLAVLFLALPAWAEAQSISKTFILTWQNNGVYNQIGVYRDGQRIALIAGNLTTYSDPVTGTAGQQFTYYVTAIVGTAESANSNTAVGTLLPNAPSNLTLSALSSSEIQMTWQNNVEQEDSQEAEITGGKPRRTFTVPIPAYATTYVVAGLRRNTSYTGRMRSMFNGQGSAWSNSDSETTRR